MIKLIPPLILPPVYILSLVKDCDKVFINPDYLYTKKEHLNRFEIITSQGTQKFTVPLQRPKNNIPSKDVFVDDSQNWRKKCLQAIATNYRKAPFFDHYFPELEEVLLDKEYNTLYLLSSILLEQIQKIIDYDKASKLSDSGITKLSLQMIHNKISSIERKAYYQLFTDKFMPDISCLDLIMNEGPCSYLHL